MLTIISPLRYTLRPIRGSRPPGLEPLLSTMCFDLTSVCHELIFI